MNCHRIAFGFCSFCPDAVDFGGSLLYAVITFVYQNLFVNVKK